MRKKSEKNYLKSRILRIGCSNGINDQRINKWEYNTGWWWYLGSLENDPNKYPNSYLGLGERQVNFGGKQSQP